MSQNKRVLDFMRDHKRGITQDDCEYKISPRIKRLASRIHDLKSMGHEIYSEMEKRGDVRYSRYTLIKENPNARVR